MQVGRLTRIVWLAHESKREKQVKIPVAQENPKRARKK